VQYPPDAWGRVSFLAVPLLFFRRIDDSNYPLGARMDVDVPDFDRLAVSTPVPVECLDHAELQLQQLGRVTSVHPNVDLIHVTLALAQESEPTKADRHDLDAEHGLKFRLEVHR
jgi:hypothetical protein